MGYGVWGMGCGVEGLGLKVWGAGLRVSWHACPTEYIASSKTIYRVTSLIRNSLRLGSYSRTVSRALWSH